VAKRGRRVDAGVSDDVWPHPHAQATLDGFNRHRIATGLPPLTREQATEAVRQKLAQNERDRRWLARERLKFRLPGRYRNMNGGLREKGTEKDGP
jgi:hypothetical protein